MCQYIQASLSSGIAHNYSLYIIVFVHWRWNQVKAPEWKMFLVIPFSKDFYNIYSYCKLYNM